MEDCFRSCDARLTHKSARLTHMAERKSALTRDFRSIQNDSGRIQDLMGIPAAKFGLNRTRYFCPDPPTGVTPCFRVSPSL
jgi:hypothetical protein